MKKNVLLILATFFSISLSANTLNDKVSNTTILKSALEQQDTTNIEIDKLALCMLTDTLINQIDSLKEIGAYYRILDITEQIESSWEKYPNSYAPIELYLQKGCVLMDLEDWNGLSASMEKAITIYQDNEEYRPAVRLLYDMAGMAKRMLEDYTKAIRNYELELLLCEENDLGNQGNSLCNLAICYYNLEKYSIAQTFFDKGFEKYFTLFDTTKKKLLKKKCIAKNELQRIHIGVFGAMLMQRAILAETLKDDVNKHDYILMSANCGDETAKEEYNRIYKRYY